MAGYVHLTIKPRYCFLKIWIELLAAISYCSTLALDATHTHQINIIKTRRRPEGPGHH